MTETSIKQRVDTLAELNASLRTLLPGFSQALAETVGTRCVEAWFLGTKAENTDLFLRLVGEVIRDQASWRRNFHPEDPSHITHTIKQDPRYLEAVDRLEQEFWQLLAFLKKFRTILQHAIPRPHELGSYDTRDARLLRRDVVQP